MQVPPSPALSHIVKHFLVIENDGVFRTTLRMFSDGNTGMVFNFRDPLSRICSDSKSKENLPRCFTYGQMSEYQTIFAHGKIAILVVVFQPHGAASLLGIPASELTNQIINSEDLYGCDVTNLHDQLNSITSHSERIKLLETFLLSKIKIGFGKLDLARQLVKMIDKCNGNISVAQLTDFFNVSERLLQRTFAEHVGISPKRYSGVVKVQHFLKLLRNKPAGTSLTELTYECEFYDQAHLIRELKNLSGLTPSQYATKSHLLAANFISLPG